MKNTIKLALVAAMAMGATSAFATNGDSLIGLGAKSRAMGGTGIAHYNGAESALSNPALLAATTGSEVMFGGTYFHPSVSYDNAAAGSSSTSQAKHNVIPEIAISSSLENGLAIGVGIFGSAGMGVDYRGTALADGVAQMTTSLQLMKFAVPVAYKIDGLSVGIAPVLQYGALDINYDGTGMPGNPTFGAGVSQDFGLGYQLGAAYELTDMGITIGAQYTSAISMEYQGQISAAAGNFGLTLTDELEQPAEFGVGIDWTEGDISATLDYKKIKWGSAAGYQDFNWEDQNVYALGLEYRMDDLAVRAGYNYASNCVKESANSAINFFNLAGFPAIVESHYTIGAGYAFSKVVSADFAFTYAPETEETYSITGFGTTVTTKHSQYAATAAINFNF